MAINTDPEIHELVICSNVFIRKDGKYLVLKRSSQKQYAPNFVSPVGGKVKLNENPYQAALRESKEETGVNIKNMKLEALSFEMHPGNKKMVNWLVFHFSADYDSGKITETDEGELLLLTGDEFKASNLFPPCREMIDHIFNSHDGTVFASFELDGNLDVINKDIRICKV